mgnify:CR=1 FL=1
MQEDALIYLLVFLAGQTVAIWKKLSKIEQKIDSIQKHNDKQDEQISKLTKVIAERIEGAAKELIT